MSAVYNLQFNFLAIANQKDQRDSNEIVVHQMNTAHCLRFLVHSIQAYTQMIIKIHNHCIWILICSLHRRLIWRWEMFKSRKNDYLVNPVGWNSNDIPIIIIFAESSRWNYFDICQIWINGFTIHTLFVDKITFSWVSTNSNSFRISFSKTIGNWNREQSEFCVLFITASFIHCMLPKSYFVCVIN